MAIKAKMTFESGAEFEWEIWNGTPQAPKPVYDRFRRLGSGRQRVQKIGFEANPSISKALAFFLDHEIAYKQAEELVDHISERFTLEFYGKQFENCLLLNAEYNIKAAMTNGFNHTLEAVIEYMIDGEEE